MILHSQVKDLQICKVNRAPLIFLILMVLACNSPKHKLIVGRWHIAQVDGYQLQSHEETIIEFRNNGDYVRTQPGKSLKAKWKMEEEETSEKGKIFVYIERQGKDNLDVLQISKIDEDSMTVVEMSRQEMVLRFYRMKD